MKNSSITPTSPNQQPFPLHDELSATISSAENHAELNEKTQNTNCLQRKGKGAIGHLICFLMETEINN
jgi:hypothetical protein